jgi:hypothetical protein
VRLVEDPFHVQLPVDGVPARLPWREEALEGLAKLEVKLDIPGELETINRSAFP